MDADKKEIRLFRSSRKWNVTRFRHAKKYPDCVLCTKAGKKTPVESVHHIKGLATAFELRIEPSNLASLCYQCHNEIEGQERRGISMEHLFEGLRVMGKRGPKRKPLAQGLLDGDHRTKARIAAGAIDLPSEIPPPPGYLSPAAVRVYNETCLLLHESKIVTKYDKNILARYADSFVNWLAVKFEVSRLIQTNQLLMEAGMTEKIHPVFSLEETLHKRLLEIEKQFGLTAASRAELTVEKPDGGTKEKPSLDAFMKNRQPLRIVPVPPAPVVAPLEPQKVAASE